MPLVAIAAALDVPVAWLVLDSTPAPRIVRAGDRPTMPPVKGAHMTEVDAGTSRDMCIIEAVVDPGASTGVHSIGVTSTT